MNLKYILPIFAHDKLSHYQWGSWFAAIAATVVVLVGAIAVHQPVWISALAGAVASFAVARAAGVLGERADAAANAKAIAEGGPVPYEVSKGDVRATTLGCLPSAVPLLAVAYVAHMLGV